MYIEVKIEQRNHEQERICGDVFLSKRVKEENRIVAVLSDGLGHGVKANMLATLTATMAQNFTIEHKDFPKIAEVIMNTLPECSDRKINYATFTIIDILVKGEVRVLQYDNPDALVLRGKKMLEMEWQEIVLESEKNAGKVLKWCTFTPRREDRILVFSDGVVQSGLGSKKYPFGWGLENAGHYALKLVEGTPGISAQKLAHKMVNMAYKNDGYHAKDDTSCASIYFRKPRELLICTGPPYEEENDKNLAGKVENFPGKKILCGATTADIIARELELEIEDSFQFTDEELPPVSFMQGIDLVTEGILTLSKVNNILKNFNKNTSLENGPADKIVKHIRESDHIHFIIGTRINIAHQDPNLPVDLEIRRTVVKRIARLLEDKFLKEVSLEYI
jgi:hypothetical protein